MHEFTVLNLESTDAQFNRDPYMSRLLVDSHFRYEVLGSNERRERKCIELSDRITREFWKRDFDLIVGTDYVNHGTIRTLQRPYIQDIPYVALWRYTTLQDDDYTNLSNAVSALCVDSNLFLEENVFDNFFENLIKIVSKQMYEAIKQKSRVALDWNSSLKVTYDLFYLGEKTKETGVVKRIKSALSQGALTKKQMFVKIGWFGGDYWGGTRRRALINGVNFKFVNNVPVYYLEEKDLEKLDLKDDLAGETRIFTVCSCVKKFESRVRQISVDEKQFLKECVPILRFQGVRVGEFE